VCVPITLDERNAGALAVTLAYAGEGSYDGALKFFGIVASMIGQALRVHRLVEAERQRLLQENMQLRQELKERYDFRNIVGNSRAGVAGRREQHHGPGARRVRHRQGADRPRPALQLAAREQALRQGELRGAATAPAPHACSAPPNASSATR
jgi:hypothetical protein